MKAVVCEDFAPLDQLCVKNVTAPEAAPGMVVVDVAAAGVNYPDGLIVQGLYQSKPPLPFVPGTEVAGTVAAVGDGVTRFKPGDRVLGYCLIGGFAEQVAIPAQMLLALPDGIPLEEAAGLQTAHATAHHALKQRANLQPGETLVITGAAGGTGLAAIQIGKAMGARVIAVCSSDEKLAVAEANGADVLINYSSEDLKTALKAATDGRGVDVAYDTVGGDAFDPLSRCMGWNGRLLVIGFASGRIPQLPVNLALVKGYSLVGVFWGTFTQKQPHDFAANMQELLQWYLDGKVKVVIDQIFPLHDTVAALNKVMNRQVVGKVIVKP